MTSNKKRIRLSEIIGPAFYETHKLIDMGVIDEAVEAGGRASLKSSYVGTELVLQILKHPDCHALVTRQVGDTMRDSVYAQILWAIDKLGLTAKFKCTQSPLQCTYTPTGQRILFRGLDDPQKIKSIKLPFGYIGILWFEEADQIKGGEDAVRNVQQSALRGGEFGLQPSGCQPQLGKPLRPRGTQGQAHPSFDLPASPCRMARPEVSGAGGVHQGNTTDEIPP